MGSASSTSAPDTKADAASQRCGGMANNAENRMAAMPTAGALNPIDWGDRQLKPEPDQPGTDLRSY